MYMFSSVHVNYPVLSRFTNPLHQCLFPPLVHPPQTQPHHLPHDYCPQSCPPQPHHHASLNQCCLEVDRLFARTYNEFECLECEKCCADLDIPRFAISGEWGKEAERSSKRELKAFQTSIRSIYFPSYRSIIIHKIPINDDIWDVRNLLNR